MGKKKRKQKNDKKDYSKIHFKNAFKERFAVDINRHNIRELVNDIKEGNNIIKETVLSLRVTAYEMIFMKKRCVILFDWNRFVPVTALTLEMELKSYRDNLEDEYDNIGY